MTVLQVQRFEVSLKAFILDAGRALFVRESNTGYWELPGGRIDVGEEMLPQNAILAREIAEELGSDLEIIFGDHAVTWTRAHPGGERFVFLVARIGELKAGAPVLSDEHDRLAWLGVDEWQALALPPDSGYAAAIPELWRVTAERRR